MTSSTSSILVLDQVLPIHPVPTDQAKIRSFAITPVVGLDLVTPLIPQHLFDLVISSSWAARSFQGGCRMEP